MSKKIFKAAGIIFQKVDEHRSCIATPLLSLLIATGSMIAQSPAAILWTDKVQTGNSPWGFDGSGIEHPIGTTVPAGDANGVNLSRAADPAGGSGYAMRHFATFDEGGSRSQAGMYGDANTVFGNQAKKPEGIWVAQEWYFPAAISANGDAWCWINLWDWHSIDANRGNRWHTSPGLMLARDGTMKVLWEWGGAANSINPTSITSNIAMPVGRWFDIEMHYVWSATPSATITLWIDGQLALEQTGVQTRAASHQTVETYMKFYGSSQGRGPWVPTPTIKYTRNVRIADARIWQNTGHIVEREKQTGPVMTRITLSRRGTGAAINIGMDRRRIESITAFSPDGRRHGTLTRAELMAPDGSGLALLRSGKAGGVVIVRARGDGVEETKATVLP